MISKKYFTAIHVLLIFSVISLIPNYCIAAKISKIKATYSERSAQKFVTGKFIISKKSLYKGMFLFPVENFFPSNITEKTILGIEIGDNFKFTKKIGESDPKKMKLGNPKNGKAIFSEFYTYLKGKSKTEKEKIYLKTTVSWNDKKIKVALKGSAYADDQNKKITYGFDEYRVPIVSDPLTPKTVIDELVPGGQDGSKYDPTKSENFDNITGETTCKLFLADDNQVYVLNIPKLAYTGKAKTKIIKNHEYGGYPTAGYSIKSKLSKVRETGDVTGIISFDDKFYVYKNTSGNLNITDNDYPKKNLSISAVTQPGNGNVIVTNGTSIVYTPYIDYTGTDSFVYTVIKTNDGSGTPETDSSKVDINVVTRIDNFKIEDFNDWIAQEWVETIDANWNIVSTDYGIEYRAETGSKDYRMQSTFFGNKWKNLETQVTIRQTSESGTAVLVVRATDDFSWQNEVGSAYLVGINANAEFYVGKYVNGEFSMIKQGTSSSLNSGSSTNNVKINIEGTAIQVRLNNKLAFSGSDSSITEAGRIALMGNSGYNGTTHYFDDVKVDAAAQPTYSITGQITGDIPSEVTITLSGYASATTTTISNGYYSFTNLFSGDYKVTASQTGYLISPDSHSVTINDDDVSGIDFASSEIITKKLSTTVTSLPIISSQGTNAANTIFQVWNSGNGTMSYSISETSTWLSVSPLSGTSSGEKDDITVSYTTSGLATGTYSAAITVTADDATNSPVAINVSLTVTDQSTYSIRGQVIGDTLDYITMRLSGDFSASTTTDTNGIYSFTGLTNGNYTVTPSKSGYYFTPQKENVTILNADQSDVNFTAVSSGGLTNDMCYIPAGTFSMGDHHDAGASNERPVHDIYIDAFYMDKYEVSNEKMREVMQWAYDNGKITSTVATITNLEGNQQELLDLDDSDCQISFFGGTFSVDTGKTNFPCVKITWYGSQAYCNYKSDMEGLGRCINFSDWSCNWSSNGYRLPTEAEWEKAARGGLSGNYYPWISQGGSYGDHIDGSKVNYYNSGDPWDNGTTPCGYYDGNQTPVGIDMANGYGLYDMAGNVTEWNNDWYLDNWYSQAGATNANARGPVSGSAHVLRGGSWGYGFAGYSVGCLRCAYRTYSTPLSGGGDRGFRCARGVTSSDYYSISGTVTGDVQKNVTIMLSGDASITTQTDTSGIYSFSGLINGNYTVTPSKAGYNFTPQKENVTILNADQSGVNFTAVSSGGLTNEMCYIPAGSFSMGDTFSEGESDERPVHNVYIDAFYMDKYGVSNEKMREIMQWAYDNGKITATVATVTNLEGDQQELLDLDSSYCQISFSSGTFYVDAGKTNYPCVEVNWYGACAYSNFKSEKEGLNPCYNFTDWSCNWNANGYRLPTEAEREKAARGGLSGKRYPWGDSIDSSKANYGSYKGGTTPCGYYDGNQTPTGTDMANGYGLYDMAGNVWEWCWDWYSSSWYSQAGATNDNTRGPASEIGHVYRGGRWSGSSAFLHCARRGNGATDSSSVNIGFRCVRQ